MDGSLPIHELDTDFGLELPESSSYVTLAGLVLERLGHIPVPGQSLRVEPYRLTVLALEGRRVARVLVEPESPPTRARRAPDAGATSAHFDRGAW